MEHTARAYEAPPARFDRDERGTCRPAKLAAASSHRVATLWQRDVMGVAVTAESARCLRRREPRTWNALDRMRREDPGGPHDLEVELDHCDELPAFEHHVPPLSLTVGVDHLQLATRPGPMVASTMLRAGSRCGRSPVRSGWP